MKPTIRKLLVLTNQSSSGSLIYFSCNVLTKYFAMLCKSITQYAGIALFENSFIFKVPVEKVVIDEKELHGIDIGENIAKEKKPDVLQAITSRFTSLSSRLRYTLPKRKSMKEQNND